MVRPKPEGKQELPEQVRSQAELGNEGGTRAGNGRTKPFPGAPELAAAPPESRTVPPELPSGAPDFISGAKKINPGTPDFIPGAPELPPVPPEPPAVPSGLNLYMQRGTAAAVKLGMFTHTPAVDPTPLLVPGTPEERTYTVPTRHQRRGSGRAQPGGVGAGEVGWMVGGGLDASAAACLPRAQTGRTRIGFAL